ncbi:MAG: TcaA NTF2-like domain-containing protein [Bacillota bacterium]
MSKFCTNCGHPNNNENQVCVECGRALNEVDKKAVEPIQSNGPKKSISLKTKLLAGVAIFFIAALGIFYTWGTKMASADSTATKFIEAVHEKNAKALSKYVALSNGTNISVKEAEAFIELYAPLSSAELEEMMIIEKNGKFAGVFDSHKVVIDPEYVYFPFSYEGLKLELNGEEVKADTSTEGEYKFSGIVPGQYDAEFVFNNGQVVYEHAFELTVHHQEDPAYTLMIEEELPLGSAVFNVGVAEGAPVNETKVMIGEEEFPVNAIGQTEEIGPLLMDGSVTAKAQVKFSWGDATSEAVPVETDVVDIAITELDQEITEQVLERFVAFLEEDLEAKAARDESVYTFLTPGVVKRFADEFEQLKEWQTYFTGSLTQVNLDGESIGFWEEGITVDAEVIYEGDEYYGADKPELEKQKTHATVKMAYDSDNKEWIVKEYWTNDNSNRSFTVEPISTIEGSKKIYEYKNATVTAEEISESEETTVDEKEDESAEASLASSEEVAEVSAAIIEMFMNEYNTLSSNATLSGDASSVTHLITQDGPKLKESIDYIASLHSKGVSTEHLGTTVDKVETIDASHVKVTTTETFIIHGTEKSSEKTYRTVNILAKNGDGWLVDELVSTKEM